MNPTQEQIDRLPKWAKTLLQTREREVTYLANRLAEYETPATNETPVTIVGFGPDPNKTLPDHSTIRFRFGEGYQDYVDFSFDYSDQGREADKKPVGVIMRSGTSSINIEPRASNSAIVRVNR